MENKIRYITEKEVSSITGLALSTLRNDRATQRRIPHYKIGRSVRYLMDDVINFMESNKISSYEENSGVTKFSSCSPS